MLGQAASGQVCPRRHPGERLPGWRYFDTGPIVALFSRAGFTRLTVTSLERVHRASLLPPSDQPPYGVVGYAD